MELLACLLVLAFIKIAEWSIKLIVYCFKLSLLLIALPFKMIFKLLFSNHNQEPKNPTKHREYNDPIEKMEDHWDNHPEDLDMEDIFWLDELCGDDD